MKFAVLILFAASTSWACPDLAGDYSCTSPDLEGKVHLRVEQSQQAEFTKYIMNDTNFLTDAQWHFTDHKNDDYLSVSGRRAQCETSHKLLLEESFRMFKQGELQLTIYNHYELRPVKNGQVQMNFSGYSEQKDEKTPFSYILNCTGN